MTQSESSITSTLFYALIRMNLWADCTDKIKEEMAIIGLKPYPPEVWEKVFLMARRQTVLGMLAQSVYKLPSSVCPSVVMIRELMMVEVRISQTNQQLNKALWLLSRKLHDVGIPHVLLKGQGVAQEYADPSVRQCGDIDMWVGELNYPTVCEKVRQWGFSIHEEETESEKHLHFSHGGVCIEIHRVAAIMLRESHKKTFSAWTGECMQRSDQNMFVTEEGIILPTKQAADASNAVRVSLPDPTFNAFFLFQHLYNHFLNGGIGLRQICDWCRYLDQHQTEINQAELMQKLKSYDMLEAWQTFGSLCVHSLGLSSTSFPFYHAGLQEKADLLMHRIEKDGNFGFATLQMQKRPKGLIQGKFYSFRQRSIRQIQIFKLFPKDTLIGYSSFLFTGIRNVFVDEYKQTKKIRKKQAEHQLNRTTKKNG